MLSTGYRDGGENKPYIENCKILPPDMFNVLNPYIITFLLIFDPVQIKLLWMFEDNPLQTLTFDNGSVWVGDIYRVHSKVDGNSTTISAF